MALTKGARVTIYEDPFTQRKQEGRATLVKCLHKDKYGEYERWRVRFDNEPEATHERMIVPKEHAKRHRDAELEHIATDHERSYGPRQ